MTQTATHLQQLRDAGFRFVEDGSAVIVITDEPTLLSPTRATRYESAEIAVGVLVRDSRDGDKAQTTNTETGVETMAKALPPHMLWVLEKARVYDEQRAGVVITDVTPAGYGVVETEDSYSTEAPHLTTEQSRLRRSIDEARTILKGRLSSEKRNAIQRSMRRAQERLDAMTSRSETDRKALIKMATDAEY